MNAEYEKDADFVRLLMEVQKPLYGYIHAHTHDHALTEDIVQDVSVVLWQKHDQYDPTRPFLGWALGIARYQVLTSRRRSARSRLVFDDELIERLADCYEENEPDLEERRAVLDDCMQHLSEESERLMEMRHGLGMRLKEIARELNRTVTAVGVALHRIRNALMECVDRHTNQDLSAAGGEV